MTAIESGTPETEQRRSFEKGKQRDKPRDAPSPSWTLPGSSEGAIISSGSRRLRPARPSHPSRLGCTCVLRSPQGTLPDSGTLQGWTNRMHLVCTRADRRAYHILHHNSKEMTPKPSGPFVHSVSQQSVFARRRQDGAGCCPPRPFSPISQFQDRLGCAA